MPKGLSEIGVTGLKRWAGYSTVQEEFLSSLSGSTGVKTLREMRDNDAIIGAVMLALEQTIMSTDWDVRGGGDAEREFIKENFNDMSESWSDVLTNILSMLTYGWALFEPVYKVRNGWPNSKYADKKIGWKRFALRSQDSLFDWKFADNGDVIAFRQMCPPKYDLIEIPIVKCLLFRTTSFKNNPEGRSLLRSSYRSWYFKKNIEEIEGIGIERDMVGVPVIYYPKGLNLELKENVSIKNWINTLLRGLVNDEQRGLALPEDYKVELIKSPGQKGINTDDIIYRYNNNIAMSLLGQFIMLGSRRVGSFAMSKDHRDLFNLSIDGWLGRIADVINNVAIPRLLRYNLFDETQRPSIKFVSARADMQLLADFINKLGSVIDLQKYPDLQAMLLRIAHLDEGTQATSEPL